MRWLPSTLFGRLVLVLLGGLLLAQFLGAAILLRDRATVLYEASGFAAAKRIASIVHVFDTLTPDQRRLMVPALSTTDLHVILGKDKATRRYLYQLFPRGYGQQVARSPTCANHAS